MMVWFGLIGIVASIRCCNIALPAIGWSDLGRDDLIRDPSPAAKITTDILRLRISARGFEKLFVFILSFNFAFFKNLWRILR